MEIPNLQSNDRGRHMNIKTIRALYPDFYKYINDNYPTDISFSEKLYWYIHDISSYPKCKCCNNRVKFNSLNDGYRKHCSSKCSNSDVDKIKKQQETTFNNYGVYNPSQIKDISLRKQQTCKEHYGGYGSEYIKNKCRQTCLKRYGNENYRNLSKHRETCLKRYGVDHPSKCPEIMEKKRQTNMKHFGMEWSCQLEQARHYSNNSKPNKKFEDLLIANNIEYKREFAIDKYSYDFKVDNILIEIDPIGTHNSDFGIFGNKPTSKTYHLEKTKTAIEKGFRCIHVWDWDDLKMIVNMLKPKSTIYARNCEVKSIEDKNIVKTFLNANHLQGNCRSQTICIGLYYHDELVEIMTFGRPRYNKKYEYELLRLCTKYDCKIIGGSKKIFSYFVALYRPVSIISYCDASKFTGDIYNKLGFTLYRDSTPSKHWYKNGIHITDNLLRQRGFDQLFKTNYGKGTSNEELMYKHKFLTLWDCGQKTYIWTKKEEK